MDGIKAKALSPLLFAIFLVSGFCGLLYQVLWLRLAYAAFGIVTPVLSVVLSVFMFGLALGSWAGGRFAGRLRASARFTALVPYAAAEAVIGLGGLAVPFLFEAGRRILLSSGTVNSLPYLVLSGVLLSLSILPWCVAMGATIPLMMKFIQQTRRGPATGFSFLYLANVIGAVCGTIASAAVLIEALGLRKTLLVAAGANFSIALLSLILNFVFRGKAASDGAPADGPETSAAPKPEVRRGLALSILFVTGFISMAMEVVWTRAFTPVLWTTIYAFAGVLAVYLLATWGGVRLYRRQRQTGRVKSVATLVSVLALFSLLPIAAGDPRLDRLDIVLDIEIILASIVPLCATLGYLTSKLIDDLSGGDPRSAGKAYAVNTAGCILGPLFAGYILLPAVGVRVALIILAVPFALYLLGFGRALLRRRPVRAVSTILLTAVLFLASITVFLSYEDGRYRKSAVIRRDATASVISYGTGRDKRLLVNGVGMTVMTPVTKCMAHVPLALRPRKPESALVICLGMGTTFRSAASWGIDVTAVELVPGVAAAFGFYFRDARRIIRDPRHRIVVDDGRRYLQRIPAAYDAIIIDPPPPMEAAGSSLLYSEEFYRLAKTRMKPDGILQQWIWEWDDASLRAVLLAVRREFPFVRAFLSLDGWGLHISASREPFELPTPAAFAARLPEKAARDLVEWSPGQTPERMIGILLGNEISIDGVLAAGPAVSLTDDRPVNEYFLLRRLLNGKIVSGLSPMAR